MEYISCMVEKRNAYRIIERKPEEKPVYVGKLY
jgi:hypothetical protein